VSWKDDKNLVDVRLFEAEEDEEGSSQLHPEAHHDLRDLDRHEGLDLKNAFSQYYVDEEEDGAVAWQQPGEIDLSSTPDAETKGIKRGGSKEPDSPESHIQSLRERDILLVLYRS